MINKVARRFTVGQLVLTLLIVMIGIAAINVGAVYVNQSEYETMDKSVAVAGEQRMLTQQMARYANDIVAGDAVGGSLDAHVRLEQAADRYESNLQALREGGEVDGRELDSAPEEVHGQLETQREEWDEFHDHVTTIHETDPHDPEYEAAINYLVDHEAQLLEHSDRVVGAYAVLDDGDRYETETEVAGQQRMRTLQITRTALYIDQHERPGADGPDIIRARNELEQHLDEYEASLDALENGGEYDGHELQPAPPEVQSELEATREVWEPFAEEARTVATTGKYDLAFVESYQYVNDNADQLLETSDETVTAYSAFIDSRTRLVQQLLLGLFVINFAVFAVGAVLTRRYVGIALSDLNEAVNAIGNGSLETDVSDQTRAMAEVYDDGTKNEVIGLAAATGRMESYLDTVVRQAQALARQDFDAPALEEDVPGEFGTALSEMHHDLEALITDMERAKAEAETAKERAEESKREAEALASTLEEQAIAFNDVMEQAAAGDLGVRMDTDADVESMRRIATSFNEMLASFETTIAEIQAFADDVAATSEEVTASTEEVSEASEDVSMSIQQIADGADDQSRQLQTVASEMSQLSATVEEIASQATTVANTVQETTGVGESGREAAEDAIEQMREIETLTEQTVETVEDLEAQFDEITDIVELITSIADETNLLALNANIEAAHADASSDGFTVVANEVKSLAEETKDSAEDIESHVDAVQTQMATTVEGVRRMRTRIDDGVDTVAEAVDAFEEVVDNVDRANQGVQEIDDATDDQATSTEEAVAMVDDAAQISEETSDETDAVSAAAEEQTASLEDVEDGMQTLASQAAELQDHLEAFEVEQDRTEQAPTQ